MAGSSEINEELRLRQVHQYLSLPNNGRNEVRPSSLSPGIDISATKKTSPNTALTAFTQLCTWKLNCQRAIISLVDREDMHFLAESTMDFELGDVDNNDEWLWMGCSGSGPPEHAMCSLTIKAPVGPHGFPLYCINDLQDSRWRDVPFVKNFPFLRYYAGTPLITPEGFRLGSL